MNSPVDDKSGATNDCTSNFDYSGDGDGDGDSTEIMLKKDEHNTNTTCTTTTNKSVRVVSVSNDSPDKAHSTVSFGSGVGCGGDGDGDGDFDADADVAFYHIVDYLSTMELYALGKTNHSLSHFLFHVPHTDSIFHRPSGRQYLQCCRNLKHSVLSAVPAALQQEKSHENDDKTKHGRLIRTRTTRIHTKNAKEEEHS